MKKPKAGLQIQIESTKPIRMVRNERGLFELEPWSMSVEELIAAVSKNLTRELPQRTTKQSLKQRRMGSRLSLFGELRIFDFSDEGLKPPAGKPINWNAARAMQLIQRADAGDGEADKVLRDAAFVFLDRDLLPPRELRDYIKTTFKRNRGNQPTEGRFALRDHLIAYSIKQVLRHSSVEIKATRNVATKDGGGPESACSIVAKGYLKATGEKLTERSINTIWGRLKRNYRPSTITAARRNKPNG